MDARYITVSSRKLYAETLLTRNNSTIMRLISRQRVRRCNIIGGAPFFRYTEKIEIRSLSLRASLVIQFRETPTAFVRNSARRNRAAFSSMYFIMRNRRAVEERERGGGRDKEIDRGSSYAGCVTYAGKSRALKTRGLNEHANSLALAYAETGLTRNCDLYVRHARVRIQVSGKKLFFSSTVKDYVICIL